MNLPSNYDMRMLLAEFSDWQREHRFMSNEPRRLEPYKGDVSKPECVRNEYAYRIFQTITAMGYDPAQVLPPHLIEQAELYRTNTESQI